MRYCSTGCYTGHSVRCVRAFGAEADESLRGAHVNELERESTNRTLLRALEELDVDLDCDNDSVEDTSELLERILSQLESEDISYQDALNKLPSSLQTEFKEMLEDGRLLRLHKPWIPWWEQNSTCELPPPPSKSDLAVTVSAARSRAATSVAFGVLDVVMSYCYTLRVYDGDVKADIKGAARLLVSQCHTLALDLRATVLAQAIRERDPADAAAVYGGGRGWVCRAMADAGRLLASASAGTKPTRRFAAGTSTSAGGSTAEDDRAACTWACRKVRFLTAWALGTGTEEHLKMARSIEALCVRMEGAEVEVEEMRGRAVRTGLILQTYSQSVGSQRWRDKNDGIAANE